MARLWRVCGGFSRDRCRPVPPGGPGAECRGSGWDMAATRWDGAAAGDGGDDRDGEIIPVFLSGRERLFDLFSDIETGGLGK